MHALLVYHSKTGHTLEAANAIAAGITAAGGSVDVEPAKNFQPSQLANHDMLIVGSPCWGGSMGPGISKPIQKVLNAVHDELKGKPCAGFAVYAGAGGENTVRSMGEMAAQKGCAHYFSGPAAKAGTALSIFKGPPVSQADLQKYQAFGAELAKVH